MASNLVSNTQYRYLPFLVQVRWLKGTFFETIAGFNSDTIAKDYAKGCRQTSIKHNLGMEYQVVKFNNRCAKGQRRYEVID